MKLDTKNDIKVQINKIKIYNNRYKTMSSKCIRDRHNTF